MIPKEVSKTASQCRHYAMCKINFLQTGLCPAGAQNHFVSYYPMGRMDIVHALAESRIPVTERLVDIAESFTLCGLCDRQCYFVTEMRTMNVMEALKETVNAHINAGKEIMRPESDVVLDRLRQIGDSHELTHDFGYITPMDFGKRAAFEYDYYFDHRDPSDVRKMSQAFEAAVAMVERFTRTDGRIMSVACLLNQGFSRMENLLYL